VPKSGATPRAFATLGDPGIGAEIRSTRLLVRDIVELTVCGDLEPLIRRLA
jgi:hypothetical protein